MGSDYQNRQFIAMFHWNGWAYLNFGISFHLTKPNMEVHIPGGFFRIGWEAIEKTVHRPKTFGKGYKIPQVLEDGTRLVRI